LATPLRNPFWRYSRDKIACEDLLVAAYRELLYRIQAEGLRTNVALKLTHLGLSIDEELAHRNVAELVSCGSHIPALGGVVRGHRSNTNFSLQERDTHVKILLPQARSASVSMESR